MDSSLSPLLVWWSPVPPVPGRCMCMGHQGRTGEEGGGGEGERVTGGRVEVSGGSVWWRGERETGESVL